jgi:hypothetical protein
MSDLGSNLYQPSPFDRIEDDLVARQAGVEHLDLECEEADPALRSVFGVRTS